MSISNHPYDLHKHGSKDAFRHREKLNDAFRKKLHDIISQEDIITSDNGRTVKVPIKALDNYHFTFDPKGQKQVGQGDGETEVGDVIQKEAGEKKPGDDEAGDEEGEEYYEAEIDLDELIEMMLEDLKLPRLDPKKKNNITTKDIEYDDVRKRGKMSNLDKKRSLVENIKRNAQSGEAKVGDISMDDLRYRTWSEHDRPVTSAVVFAMMDVSGSMTDQKKYLSRSFFFWMVNFLRHKYENVEVVFISHTTEAKIVNEHDFFHRAESGGTRCSTAYELALETIKEQYNVSQWNVFAFHFSDGDTFNDERRCVELIRELAEICNMVGYGEINLSYPPIAAYGAGFITSALSNTYKELESVENFVMNNINTKGDVWPTLRKFFSDEDL